MIVLQKIDTTVVGDRTVYFWRHTRADGKTDQFSTEPTNFTPNWCDWDEWAFAGDVCPVCLGTEWR